MTNDFAPAINENPLLGKLSFKPNSDQEYALDLLNKFIKSDENNCFVLNGSAGTGKTTLTKSLTDFLSLSGKLFYLCAPTGRASKIISDKTEKTAQTIHHLIYKINEIRDIDGNIIKIEFSRRVNISKDITVFIIDESSMISDTKPDADELFISKNSLLSDLIHYVFEGNKNNKLIFIGDSYQLPPVNSDLSAALNAAYLRKKYNLKIAEAQLNEVIRQSKESYILEDANNLKLSIDGKLNRLSNRYLGLRNIDKFLSRYAADFKQTPNQQILLAWRNISINDINKELRKLLYGKNCNYLVKGERLVMSQNYYSKIHIPNGTFLEVDEIINAEILYGIKFMDARLMNADTNKLYDGIFKIQVDHLLDSVPNYDFEREKLLWAERYKVNRILQETKNKTSDAYLSALKVRYGYAITVHKSQGGEWPNVFLYPEKPFGSQQYRWLYTAITRASENIYSFYL